MSKKATIDPEILTKQFVTAPACIDSDVKQFCERISTESEPFFVPIEPSKIAQQSECYFNLRKHIQFNGGDILYGWAIWLWRNVFIEAEHHAIWKSDDEYIDITPPINSETKILFLPDNDRKYNFGTNARFGNIQQALTDSYIVKSFIKFNSEKHRYYESNRQGKELHLNAAVLAEIEQNEGKYQLEMIVEAHSKTKRNDLCICTSGKKFKKCCMHLISYL